MSDTNQAHRPSCWFIRFAISREITLKPRQKSIVAKYAIATTMVLALVVAFPVVGTPAHAQDDIVQQIIKDVIDGALDAAKETVRKNTGVDFSGGADRGIPQGSSEETERELGQLQEEHDRKIAKLEEELRRKLDKAEAEFEREAAKEDEAEKIEEKRGKLQKKADEAYEKFDEKVAEANQNYDEKREKILSKQ